MVNVRTSETRQLLVIASLLCVLQVNYGSNVICPTSLPRHVPSSSPCYKRRLQSLTLRRSTYGLKPPTTLLPYARLNMSVPDYLEYLKTDPFLSLHAKLLAGNSYVNNQSLYAYLKMTKKMPLIPELSEYQTLIDFMGKFPTHLLGDYMRKPSHYELFQSDPTSWISDELFAEQRLAGNNPMVIRQVTFSHKRGIHWKELQKTLNPTFDWDKAFRQVSGSCAEGKSKTDTIAKAIKKGHIFVVRHRLCDDIPLKDDLAKPAGPHHPRHMWALQSPIALFASVRTKGIANQEGKRRLKPFAIQMDYKPDSTVYTPRDGCAWTLAKLNVQLTDLIHAQIVEHLSKVHFTVEAFCVSLERHISKYHPLHAIMKYHCRGVITSNTLGAPLLVAPEGFVHQLFPVGWQGAFLLIQRASEATHWENMDLETDMKKRGVDNTEQLTYYPYRDDGRVIADTIASMVKDYINAYYTSDYDVTADYELQTYVSEISKDGQGTFGGTGNIKGFPARVDTKNELIDIFSRMIWLMTGQHAAVNFPLSDYALYAPNVPTKLYNDSRGPDMEFSIYNLPYRATLAMQNRAFISLGLLRLDRLFDYGSYLTDSRGRRVLYKHHKNLTNDVEALLDQRNKERFEGGHLTYPYFLPRWMPNGVQT